MVGNPYASPVDIGTVAYNAKVAGNIAGGAYYIWNPNLGTAGQFQAMPVTTVSATPYYMQANCAFQVRADHNGATLSFAESNKNATASANLLKTMPEAVTLTVYDANYHPWDMLYVKFNQNATDVDDNNNDAAKLSTGDFSFYSISADSKQLAIDVRPYSSEKVIPLGVHSQFTQDFIIKAEDVVLPQGGKLYLHDKMLNQYVQLTAGTEYRFSVTADKATQGNERFELGMSPAQVAGNKGLQVSLQPNPATDDVKISFTNGVKAKVDVRILDLSGVSVYSRDLGVQQDGTVKVQVSNLASGVYMVELTSGNEKVVQRLIKD